MLTRIWMWGGPLCPQPAFEPTSNLGERHGRRLKGGRRKKVLPFGFWVLLTIALAQVAGAQNSSKVYSTATRPRALAVIGDRYHSPIYIRDGLIRALVQENIPVT